MDAPEKTEREIRIHLDAWADGFIAGFALKAKIYPVYDVRIAEYHALRESAAHGASR